MFANVSRRRFVISAAAASAAFGLDRQMEFLPPAHAQKAGSAAGSGSAAMKPASDPKLVAKGWHRFKVGDVDVTQVYDGIWEKPHDPAFIKNASVDETKAALKAGGLTDAHVPIPFTVTVLRSKGKYVLIDAGTGGQVGTSTGQMMAKGLLAAGIEPWKVSTILVSHFHPDHISGLMGKETNSQIFPDAQILMPAAEYKYWTDPSLGPKLPEARRPLVQRIQSTFPKWKNIGQFEDGAEVFPGVKALAAYGHTPGHTAYLVGSGKKQLLVTGDTANVPALFVRNPSWQAVFDTDGAMAEQTRRRLFDRAIADGAMIAGYHWGMPGAGTVRKDGNSYVFVPVG
jgi:glyoxylase-like metal-dependent hydrolase (beta-lactamase superfamily II)